MGKMRQNGFRGLAVVLGIVPLFAGMPVGGLAATQLEELVVRDNWDKVDAVLPDGAPVTNQTLHTVTVVEHYMDKIRSDSLKQYKAGAGETLTLPYEILYTALECVRQRFLPCRLTKRAERLRFII